jgi:hypothetical protein
LVFEVMLIELAGDKHCDLTGAAIATATDFLALL